jgi:hypothetical protein
VNHNLRGATLQEIGSKEGKEVVLSTIAHKNAQNRAKQATNGTRKTGMEAEGRKKIISARNGSNNKKKYNFV